MSKKTSRKRPQNPKTHRHANPAMHAGMVELRKGSRAQPHRDRSKYERNDFRNDSQRGEW